LRESKMLLLSRTVTPNRSLKPDRCRKATLTIDGLGPVRDLRLRQLGIAGIARLPALGGSFTLRGPDCVLELGD
jgi:hypothetical protein